MTADDFTEAARKAARKRLSWHDEQFGDIMRPMVWMAEWAWNHLAAQEPTDAECVAVLNVKYGGTVGPHDEPYDAEEMAEARAALIDAKEARS